MATEAKFLWKKCQVCDVFIGTAHEHSSCWAKHRKEHVDTMAATVAKDDKKVGTRGHCHKEAEPQFLWKTCDICGIVVATGADHALCGPTARATWSVL